MSRLEEIKKREEEATPGPWTFYSRDSGNEEDDPTKDSECGLGWDIEEIPCDMRGRFKHGHDANFIANARSDIPWLIAEVERLQDLNQHYEKDLKWLWHYWGRRERPENYKQTMGGKGRSFRS